MAKANDELKSHLDKVQNLLKKTQSLKESLQACDLQYLNNLWLADARDNRDCTPGAN